MPSRSTEADIEYQRVDRNSPEISPPSPPTFVNDFELDVTNAFELDDFPDYSITPAPLLLRSRSPDTSNKSLLAVNETENRKKTFKTLWQTFKAFFARRFSGWRGGIVLNATFTGVVLLVNVIVLIWAAANFKFTNGIATVFKGDCAKADNLSILFHVFINILSTLLLAASNYAIQVSASPSRADIDRAHREQKSLDVGVFSFRNLKWLSKYRIAICGILFLSSVPLYMVYNSVFSPSSPIIGQFAVIFVTPEYFDPTAKYTPPYWNNELMANLRTQAMQKQLKHVGVAECNKTIAADSQNSYKSLFYVQDSQDYENSTTLVGQGFMNQAGDSTSNSTSNSTSSSSDFSFSDPSDFHLTDCWADATELDCQLSLNLGLLVGVIVANITKCVVMILMVLKFTKPSLVTRGDAIASFLEDKDPTTIGLRSIVRRRCLSGLWVFQETMPHVGTQKRWSSSLSRLKWNLSILICITFVAITGGMLAICIHVLRDLDYASSIWNLGFHQLSVYSTIYAGNEELSVTQGDNPFRFVLLVNTPQLVLSTVYLLINNLLTDMLGAWEWSKLGKVKTRLRTTVPRGQQRSTYFLQLPYKYAVPLISIMSVMHFLVSSSLYVVDIIVYSFNTASYDTVGGWLLDFSPLAIICVLLVSVLLIGLPIILGFRKLYPGIPISGSSSALISAACHPPPEEGNAGLLPVQWGVVDSTINPETGVGRCSISSGEVSTPVEGQLYS